MKYKKIQRTYLGPLSIYLRTQRVLDLVPEAFLAVTGFSFATAAKPLASSVDTPTIFALDLAGAVVVGIFNEASASASEYTPDGTQTDQNNCRMSVLVQMICVST